MPLEIRELVIRATVEPNAEDQQAEPASASNEETPGVDINAVVEKVLAILKEKTER